MDALLDALGSPAAVGLGVTALVLLGTTIYLAKGNAGGTAGGRRRSSNVNGEKAERPPLDVAVSCKRPPHNL